MKGQLFSLIFWLVIYPLAGLGGFLLTAALLLGTPFFAVFTLSFLLSVYCNLRGIIHLRKVRRQLRAGEPLRAAVRPRKKARRYQAVWAADLLLTAVWVLMAVGYWKADLDGDFTHLLAGYVEEIDVPTLRRWMWTGSRPITNGPRTPGERWKSTATGCWGRFIPLKKPVRPPFRTEGSITAGCMSTMSKLPPVDCPDGCPGIRPV